MLIILSKVFKCPFFSLVLKAEGEGYPPLFSGVVRTWLFRERLSVLARKLLKRVLGARGRHQCVLWHRGDPAGWTWHKSLGAWFDFSIARKTEDLQELLLRTPFSNVYNYAASTWQVQGLALTTDSKTSCVLTDKLVTTDKHERLTSTSRDKSFGSNGNKLLNRGGSFNCFLILLVLTIPDRLDLNTFLSSPYILALHAKKAI